jgi:hypothetical protein
MIRNPIGSSARRTNFSVATHARLPRSGIWRRRRTGDAALRNLGTPKDGCAEISGPAAWQRMLDQHYP